MSTLEVSTAATDPGERMEHGALPLEIIRQVARLLSDIDSHGSFAKMQRVSRGWYLITMPYFYKPVHYFHVARFEVVQHLSEAGAEQLAAARHILHSNHFEVDQMPDWPRLKRMPHETKPSLPSPLLSLAQAFTMSLTSFSAFSSSEPDNSERVTRTDRSLLSFGSDQSK